MKGEEEREGREEFYGAKERVVKVRMKGKRRGEREKGRE